ncbi:MAG: hypothetical protein ABI949_00870 [Ilumatobacteraceae bacterium]
MKKVVPIAIGALVGLTIATVAHAAGGVTAGIAGPASGPGPVVVSAANTDSVTRTDTVIIHWARSVNVTSTDARCVLGSYSHRVGRLTVIDPEFRCALTLAPGASASLASAMAPNPTTSLSVAATTAIGSAFYYFNPGTPAAIVPGNVLVYGDLAVGHQAIAKLYVSNTGTLSSPAGSATLTLGPTSYGVVIPAVPGGASQQYVGDVTLSPSTAGPQPLTFTTSGGSSTRTVTVLSGLASMAISSTQPPVVAASSVFVRTITVSNLGDGPTTGYVLVSEPLNELSFVSAGPECHEQITISGTVNNRTVHRSVECVIYAVIEAGSAYTLAYSLQAPPTPGVVNSIVSITGLVGPGSVAMPNATSSLTVA